MFLPTNQKEMQARGWQKCDFILVTPDAYVDHPSFAMAILGRFLEAKGFKVGILAQPQWQDPKNFLILGEPKLAWGVSGGNVDSMVLNYTPNLKRRNEDEYAENGSPFFPDTEKSIKNKIRPDRTVIVYSNQIKQVSKNKPLIIGGIEASLRRLAHYDYWSNSVKRSILFDAKADILVYGMGEIPLLNILKHIQQNLPLDSLREPNTCMITKTPELFADNIELPSFEEVKSSKTSFAKAFKLFYEAGDNRTLIQKQDTRFLVQFPSHKSTTQELDEIYNLEFERKPHPQHKHIPAYEMIKDSITSHRGCYGKCSFCAIHSHQGALIISRSQESILKEVETFSRRKDFNGTISDIGGPSANMYASTCKIGGCVDPNCLNKNGTACSQLISGANKYSQVLLSALSVPHVKHVYIGSGLRFDPALMDEKLLTQVLSRHSPGQIKIAPESGSDAVLKLMNKPLVRVFKDFKNLVDLVLSKIKASKKLIPYIIIGHPGETPEEVLHTVNFLIDSKLEGNQFQIFTPTPMTLSTAMYYLEMNPLTGEKIHVEKNIKIIESWKNQLVHRSNKTKPRSES